MSAIPELEQALVDAGRRHYRRGALARGRRRLARPLRLAAPALALAAVAVVVVIIARVAAPPREERPAIGPPTRSPERLARDFAIFRRARRASDALPARVPYPPYADTRNSRLVGAAGGQRAFVFPSDDPDRGAELCTFTTVSGTGGNGMCAPLVAGVGDSRLLASRSRRVSDGAPLLLAIFRDGITEARITLRDGTILDRPIRENAIFLALPSQAVSVSWTDASGVSHAQAFAGRPHCPRFEPLPPDALAEAKRAALAAAPHLYPATTNPRVTRAKRLARGDRGSDLYDKCGERTGRRGVLVELQVTPRIRSASLSQGALLLGRIRGRMTVWERLH